MKNLMKYGVCMVSIAIFSTLFPSNIYAAPHTDYISPVTITAPEDPTSDFDISGILGVAYTNGGQLPNVTDTDVLFRGTSTASTTAATSSIPANTTGIRVTAYGANDQGDDEQNDDYIQINAYIDLDTNSDGFNTHSGVLTFPFEVGVAATAPDYAWQGATIGLPSNDGSATTTGNNISEESITFDVTGGTTTLEIFQTQSLVNTIYFVEYLSAVGDSVNKIGADSFVLTGSSTATGTGITLDTSTIPSGTDYIIVQEVGGRPSGDSRVEAKILSRTKIELDAGETDVNEATGVVTTLRGKGANRNVVYGFSGLDIDDANNNGALTDAPVLIGDTTGDADISHSPDFDVSGTVLTITRSDEVASSSDFTSQYAIEYYQRTGNSSATLFLGSSVVNASIVGGGTQEWDLVIPPGATLGLLTMSTFNLNSGSDATNENWGFMQSVVEIGKEVSTSTYEDRVSGTWVFTRASTPDTISWEDVPLDTQLVRSSTNDGCTPGVDCLAAGVTANVTDWDDFSNGLTGGTTFSRFDNSGIDTLKIATEQSGTAGQAFMSNNMTASIQWYGLEPIVFEGVPQEFEFTYPARDDGGGQWTLSTAAMLQQELSMSPPPNFNLATGTTYDLQARRYSEPGNFANIPIAVRAVADTMRLSDIGQTATTNIGNTVGEILATSNSSPNATTSGVAIINTVLSSASSTWEFRLNGSSTWSGVPAVSTSTALLLSADDRIRVNPVGDTFTASVDFLSWDTSKYVAGSTTNAVTNTGGGDDFTLFGSVRDTATLASIATPIVRGILDDTGASSTDGSTGDNTLFFTGSSTANAVIDVFVDGSSIGTTTANGSGSWTFDHTSVMLADGSYSITAEVIDDDGNRSDTSLAFDIEIVTGIVMPTINTPIEGDDIVNASEENDVLVSGTAATSTTVVVTVTDGATSTISATTTASSTGAWTFSGSEFDVSSLADGTLTIVAVAIDMFDNRNAATTTITKATDVPSVQSVTSGVADGSYGIGATIPIYVTFTEAVTVVGTSSLTLDTGGVASCAVPGGSTTTIACSYTVASGAESNDLAYSSTGSFLNAGSVVSTAASETAILTLPAIASGSSLSGSGAVVIDGVLPTLSSLTASESQITLTISELVSTSSVPTTTDFSISINGSTSTASVSVVSVTGSTVILDLIGTAIVAGDTIRLSFTNGANPIQDLVNTLPNALANLVNELVTNSVVAAFSGGNGVRVQLGETTTALDEDSATSDETISEEVTSTDENPSTESTQSRSFAFQFTIDLRTGVVDSSVRLLQTLLNGLGFAVAETGPGSPGEETDYYGPATAAAVVSLQEKYADNVLAPVGLSSGTGIFGRSTRGFLNDLLNNAVTAQSTGSNTNEIQNSGGNTSGDSGGGSVSENQNTQTITPVCPHFSEYQGFGDENAEVGKIQQFLQEAGFYDFRITNYYGSITENAIRDFQEKYRSEILTPWEISQPTGKWYKTSRKKANELVGCPESEVFLEGVNQNGIVF